MRVFSIVKCATVLCVIASFYSCSSNDESNKNTTAKLEPVTIKNATISGYNAKKYPNGAQGLRNDATMQKDCGNPVINLGPNDGYYAMGMEAGRFIMSLKDCTFSIKYKVDADNDLSGYGHFAFACSVLTENSAEEGAYVAFRLNEQRFEISASGYKHEHAVQMGKPAKHDAWVHAVYRQRGCIGELFIDGELVDKNENMPFLADVFKVIPENTWIGRAPFKGDKYLTHTRIKDLEIYDCALTDEEIAKL